MIKYFCDKCGTDITERRFNVDLKSNEEGKNWRSIGMNAEFRDLCIDCHTKIIKAIKE